VSIRLRLAYSLLTVFLAVSAVFFAVRLSPGDPVEKILGPQSTLEERVIISKQLGLDQGVGQQYFSFLAGVFQGHMGNSLFKKKSVVELIKERFSPTAELAFYTIAISSLLGIFIGALCAFYNSKYLDIWIRMISLTALSIPIFSLAPILVIIFSIKFDLFPVSEWGSWKNKVLPIVTLVIPLSSIVIRVMRNRMLEEKNEMWVSVIKAKGMGEKDVFWRLIVVSLPSVFTVIGIQISVVLAGTMITEIIFDIPGIGSLLFESIQNRDYPLVQGIIAYSTIVYMVVYFGIDYLNEFIDPRIRASN